MSPSPTLTWQDMLDNWLQCQSTWLYLEPIFSSDDIVKQMPEEGEKFRTVDGMWRAMMKSTHQAPAVIPIAREKERVDKLVECNTLLDAIQKGLAAYLEKKRLFFPRWAGQPAPWRPHPSRLLQSIHAICPRSSSRSTACLSDCAL